MTQLSPQETKKLILDAFDTLFNKRDYAKAAEYWSPTYIQHSAHIPPGREGLFALVKLLPRTSRYDNFLILAEGDQALLHGRFSGLAGRSWLACDRLRIENGRLAEHWDVLADEPTRSESVSGLPAIGDAFADPDHPPSPGMTAGSIGVEDARRITAPLYEALNQPAKKDVAALLAEATLPEYRSFHTDEEFLTRDQLAEVFKGMGASIPDLKWTVRDIRVIRDQVIVRGEATGTPTGDFWGQKPTGKAFKTMAIDVFTVRNGKLASAYHVENWMTALQQLKL
jgi:predicted SnoaL-like aldol condensation-catalyzing enzyme/predicted ester cyclase